MTRVALLGDRSDDVIAHRAIPLAVQIAADKLAINCTTEWIHSTAIDTTNLSAYQGFWCVPNSPYENAENIINAIRFARESDLAFIGTCGGYQHGVLEFARNVLGYSEAGSIEDNPDCTLPLIDRMFCSLREKPGQIKLAMPSRLHSLYKQSTIEEQYNCGFGVNKEYLSLFNDSALHFNGHDADDDPRAFELTDHRFFIGTAFQPERSALSQQEHPLITAFVEATAS